MARFPQKAPPPSSQRQRIRPIDAYAIRKELDARHAAELAAAGRPRFPFVLPAPYHHWSEYEHDLRRQTAQVWKETWRQYSDARAQAERDSAAWEDHLKRRRRFRDANGRFPGPNDDY